MARGTRGPANDPLSSLQQQIHKLEDRVREVETKRILTSQIPNDINNIDDPVEGEHVIDNVDDRHAWYSNGAWHKAGANQDPVGIVVGKEWNGAVPSGDWGDNQLTSWADGGGFPNPASGFGTNDRLATDPAESPFGPELSITEDDYYPFVGQTYHVDWSGGWEDFAVRIKEAGIYLATYSLMFGFDDAQNDFELWAFVRPGGSPGGGVNPTENINRYIRGLDGVFSAGLTYSTVLYISPAMFSPEPEMFAGGFYATTDAGSWDGFAQSFSCWKIGDWVEH